MIGFGPPITKSSAFDSCVHSLAGSYVHLRSLKLSLGSRAHSLEALVPSQIFCENLLNSLGIPMPDTASKTIVCEQAQEGSRSAEIGRCPHMDGCARRAGGCIRELQVKPVQSLPALTILMSSR